MLCVAFVGTFPASLAEPVRRHLTTPCEIIVASEVDILDRLPEIDVLVTMGLMPEMGLVGTRLKLVQVPGAGIDRIDRSALPPARCSRALTTTKTGSSSMSLARCWR